MSNRIIKLPHEVVGELSNVEADLYLINMMRKAGRICGCDVAAPDLKMNPPAAILVFVTHILGIWFAFMMFSNVSISHKLEGFVSFLITWQGMYKFWSTFLNSNYFYVTSLFLQDFHRLHSKNPPLALEIKTILYYGCMTAEIVSVLYCLVGLFYMLHPVIMWYGSHKQVTIMAITIPLMDWREPVGYTINTVHHAMLVFYGVIGLIVLDSLFLYQVLHAIAFSKVFQHRVTILNEMIENDTQNVSAIQAQLYECIKAHQDYLNYIARMDDHYASVCLAQLGSCELILIVSLFLTVWSRWIIGPFIAAALLFQLLECCVLGTVVTIQNETISEVIYGMTWYLLPVRLQRLVIVMIARGQNSPELNVGTVAKLNVETAMGIIKSTYSYLMMLMEFLS